MEATRRLEAERVHQKQMLPAGNELAAPINMNVLRPDVVEINRLTWLQRAAFVLGELSLWAFVILTITWLDRFRGDVSWTSGNDGGNGQKRNMTTEHAPPSREHALEQLSSA
jgi:hypothetical protein